MSYHVSLFYRKIKSGTFQLTSLPLSSKNRWNTFWSKKARLLSVGCLYFPNYVFYHFKVCCKSFFKSRRNSQIGERLCCRKTMYPQSWAWQLSKGPHRCISRVPGGPERGDKWKYGMDCNLVILFGNWSVSYFGGRWRWEEAKRGVGGSLLSAFTHAFFCALSLYILLSQCQIKGVCLWNDFISPYFVFVNL